MIKISGNLPPNRQRRPNRRNGTVIYQGQGVIVTAHGKRQEPARIKVEQIERPKPALVSGDEVIDASFQETTPAPSTATGRCTDNGDASCE